MLFMLRGSALPPLHRHLAAFLPAAAAAAGGQMQQLGQRSMGTDVASASQSRSEEGSEVYDAVVVGLGAFGAAATYHMARLGLKVLGLEAQPSIAHSHGSSHGHTRITRLAYFEGKLPARSTSLVRQSGA